jgi:hypothetical protein
MEHLSARVPYELGELPRNRSRVSLLSLYQQEGTAGPGKPLM